MQVKKSGKLRLAGLVILMALTTPTLSSCSGASPKEGGPFHHLKDGYRNPKGSGAARGNVTDWIPFFVRRISDQISGNHPLPPAKYLMDKKEIRTGYDAVKGKNNLIWLGHASFLIELGGQNILTDPFLSDYATGFPPLGPKRSVPAALSVDELPPIDVIIVSHNHYDHLDAPTIEALPNKEKIHVIVPLGMGEFFRDRGYIQVLELDWYQDTIAKNLKVTVVPAVHNSARSAFDKNETLWSGFVIEGAGKKLFFAGDTGYGEVFKKIGEKLGPIDYALIPIGAYEPRKIMQVVHVNPEEAVSIGRDIKATTLVAMHWGTIKMTDEPFDEPPKRFDAAAKQAGVAKENTWVLKIGESRLLK